jgi:hypothetical protein
MATVSPERMSFLAFWGECLEIISNMSEGFPGVNWISAQLVVWRTQKNMIF